MSNETLSNKVGNATNGAVGDQTIVNQAVVSSLSLLPTISDHLNPTDG